MVAVRENTKTTVRTEGVYVLHFDRRYPNGRRPGHYTGWSDNVEKRVYLHRAGKSRARLMEVIKQAGIGFQVAQVIEGAGRDHERWLKKKGGAARYCLICQGERAAERYRCKMEKRRQEYEQWLRADWLFNVQT